MVNHCGFTHIPAGHHQSCCVNWSTCPLSHPFSSVDVLPRIILSIICFQFIELGITQLWKLVTSPQPELLSKERWETVACIFLYCWFSSQGGVDFGWLPRIMEPWHSAPSPYHKSSPNDTQQPGDLCCTLHAFIFLYHLYYALFILYCVCQKQAPHGEERFFPSGTSNTPCALAIIGSVAVDSSTPGDADCFQVTFKLFYKCWCLS